MVAIAAWTILFIRIYTVVVERLGDRRHADVQQNLVCKTNVFWKMSKALKLVGLFCLLWSELFASVGDENGYPPLIAYDSKQIGKNAIIWNACQMADGRMVFATSKGLLIYDGEHWRPMGYDRLGMTRSAFIDSQNNLWAGGEKDFGYYESLNNTPVAFRSIKSADGIHTDKAIWQILEWNNQIYLVADDHLLVWDWQQIKRLDFPTPKRLLIHQSGEALYLSQRETGLLREREEQWELIVPDTKLNGDAVNFIEDRDNGNLLLGTFSNGFHAATPDSIEPWPDHQHYSKNGEVIYKTIALSDGRLAQATHGSGLRILGSGGRVVFTATRDDGLVGNVIFDAFQDRSGDLWLSHEKGISWLGMSSPYSFHDKRNGLDAAIIYSLERHDGTLYAGTSEGLFYMTSEGTPRQWKKVPGNDLVTWDLYSFGGNLYIAHQRGIDRFRNGQRTPVIDMDIDCESITKQLSKERFFVGNVSRLAVAEFSTDEDPSWHAIEVKGEPNSCAEFKSQVYIGTRRAGLHQAVVAQGDSHNTQEQKFEEIADPLTGEPFTWGHVSAFSNGLVATTNSGIFYLTEDDSAWSRLPGSPMDLGPEFHNASFHREKGAERLWILYPDPNEHNRPRLTRIQWPANSDLPVYELVKTEGLDRVEHLQCLLVEDDGNTVWAGGSEGVLRLDRSLSFELPESLALITSSTLYRDGEPQPLDNEAYYDYPVEHLDFTFALPHYGPIKVLYQTRLKGLSDHWSAPSTTAFKEYTNVNEGHYRFEVRPWINGKPLASTASIEFSILPPWYRTWWAYGLAALAIAFLTIGTNRYRTRKLQRANEALERAVMDRTVELERANMRLAHANTAKNRFLANVSHEIRNPMNGILGLSGLLINEANPSNQKPLQHLFETASRLKTMLDGLLDYSAIENGHIEIQTTPFQLKHVIEEATSLNEPIARDKGLKIISTVEPPEEQVEFTGDGAKIKQILYNLTHNAVKFTDQGHVEVKAVWQCTNNPSFAELRFEVNDTGPGIPENERSAIFEWFSSGRSRWKLQGARGTGLGLAISKGLAEAMGAKLWLRGSDSAGTAFCLELSLPFHHRQKDLEDSPKKAALARKNLSGLKALVVEDEAYNRYIAEKTLSKLGVNVTTAVSAEEAEKKHGETRWDFIVLDNRLPNMSGVELACRLRTSAINRNAKIIAVSAYVSELDREQFLASGVNAFIAKPFTPEELVRAVSGLFPETDIEINFSSNTNGIGTLEFIAAGDPEELERLRNELASRLIGFAQEIRSMAREESFEEVQKACHDMLPSARLARSNPINEIMASINCSSHYLI